jgi:hypothetical protein
LFIKTKLVPAAPTGFAVYQPKCKVFEVASIVGLLKAVDIIRDGKVNVPERVGAVASTLLPEPVFVTETRFLEASVARADDAVREES